MNYKHIFTLPATLLTVAALMTACDTTEEAPVQPVGDGTRTVNVFAKNIADTRTSIEYEYSDYSHLVWSEGDVVAYVTDLASDVVKEAEVAEGGYFTAELPAEATTDNTLYVLYPGDGLAGGTAADLKLNITDTQAQDTLLLSTGIRLPMYAAAPVPAAGETQVSVKYEIPVSVIRFEILSADYPADQVQSVTVTAGEPLAGDFDVKAALAGNEAFNGTSNSVTTTLGKFAPLEAATGGYIYVPVARGSYTGVTVEVTTDNNKFSFPDGTFNLDEPGVTLYKMRLVLGESSVEPKVPYFAPISEGEQFSADNKYLITYAESSGSYRVASDNITSKIDGKTFNVDPDLGGIKAEGEVMDYVFTIAPVAGTEGCYLYSEAAGNTNGNYVGSNGGTSVESSFFFMKTEPTADDTQYYWSISCNADGTQTIYNEAKARYFKYSTNLGYFCTSSVGDDNTGNEQIRNVTILKLVE